MSRSLKVCIHALIAWACLQAASIVLGAEYPQDWGELANARLPGTDCPLFGW